MIVLIKIASYKDISTIKTWLGNNLSRKQYKTRIIYILFTGLHTLTIYGGKIIHKSANNT